MCCRSPALAAATKPRLQVQLRAPKLNAHHSASLAEVVQPFVSLAKEEVVVVRAVSTAGCSRLGRARVVSRIEEDLGF